ncbi:outer membrane protein assembly factor [Propionispira raffinosivorans]|uniref:outer membrane protein assembly factor n=1 Tax=Propionispira raffinosivorans TaxID=86959 RepID=UPI000374FAAC|nr:outer membrane protein assembly factor [Propionispira raffinosivorans]
MSKNKYRSIACALVLTTSFIATNLNPVYADEVAADNQDQVTTQQTDQTAAVDNQTVSAQETTEADANKKAPEPAAEPPKTAPPGAQAQAPVSLAAAEFAAKQQARSQVEAELKQYVGQTIVSVNITGLKQVQEADAMAPVKIKAGDTVSIDAVTQTSQAIAETGYFYDVYYTFEPIPEGVKLTYHVIENPILKSVEISGNKALDTKTIVSLLTVSPGTILNTKTLNTNIKAIEAKYKTDGYILAKISDISITPDGVLKLTFNEGTLEGYTVKGNEKTKARVITREMRMKPGEPFNVKQARRSMQRVYNLGFFEDVNMKLNPGREPNSVVLETTVVEKRTGTFAVGAGYSSKDGMIGLIEVGDTNFRGIGDAVKINYEFGGTDNAYNGFVFTYTRPWLDSKQTTGTIRVYNKSSEYDDYDTNGHLTETYDKKYSGGEISLGRPVSEYSTNYVTLRDRTDYYKGHVDDSGTIDRSTPAYQSWRDANFGETRSVTLSHVTDTRDNIYSPTEGTRVALTTEFAGLGGDFNYQKYTVEDQRFFKVGHAQVIALRGQVGKANGSLPESARYMVGGQTTLRGYRDDQFRGNTMMLGTVEYRFPIVSKVQGALFTDFGDAWGGQSNEDFEFHKSIGVGIQLQTPIGPIRLDYGRGEDGGRTHFSLGGTF